ncbi:MAG: MDR family MFS transporter, partial [Frankia sp.]
VIMSGLMLVMLLATLDQTIVSTALTRISEDFHRTDLYSWVVTSYLLTSTASTPLYGKISDLLGRKTIFQIAIVIFLIGSALCGLSQNMYQLIAFRGLQGIGAGGLVSLTFSIVGDIIPPRQRGRYQGYFGAVFGASSVLGPLIGGVLVDNATWRWVFYVNIPIGLVSLVVINRVLRITYQRVHAKIDVVGALLLVAGVSLFLIAVQEVGQKAQVTSTALALGTVGLALFLAFLVWETRAPEPVLPLRLFGNPIFRVTSALSLVSGIVMFGALIFLPQYMQTVRGVSPTMSGLRLLPMLGGMLLTSIGSGRLISRFGRYRGFVISGTFLLAVGVALLSMIQVTTSLWVFSGMLFVVGAGLGLFVQTMILATQNSVDSRDLGTATSAVTFFRTLGGAIGASVLGAVLIAYERSHTAAAVAKNGPVLGPKESFTHGMTNAYLWLLPVAIVGFGLSFLLREMKLRSSATAPSATIGGPSRGETDDLASAEMVGADGAAVETASADPAAWPHPVPPQEPGDRAPATFSR